MARKQSSRDAVQFTRESAERIARVVRDAETLPAPAATLAFTRHVVAGAGKPLQLARYTATTTWLKNTVKQVLLFTANTSTIGFTGITASAINRFAIIPGHTGSGTVTTQGVLISLQTINGVRTVTNAEV